MMLHGVVEKKQEAKHVARPRKRALFPTKCEVGDCDRPYTKLSLRGQDYSKYTVYRHEKSVLKYFDQSHQDTIVIIQLAFDKYEKISH